MTTPSPGAAELARTTRALAAGVGTQMAEQVATGELGEHTGRFHTLVVSSVLHAISDAVERGGKPPDIAMDYLMAIAKCNSILIGMLLMGAGVKPGVDPTTRAATEALLADINTATREMMKDIP